MKTHGAITRPKKGMFYALLDRVVLPETLRSLHEVVLGTHESLEGLPRELVAKLRLRAMEIVFSKAPDRSVQLDIEGRAQAGVIMFPSGIGVEDMVPDSERKMVKNTEIEGMELKPEEKRAIREEVK